MSYDINRKVAKTSSLSTSKIDKYEYLTGEEILPSDQSKMTELAKFTYCSLGEAFVKQMKILKSTEKKKTTSDESDKIFDNFDIALSFSKNKRGDNM